MMRRLLFWGPAWLLLTSGFGQSLSRLHANEPASSDTGHPPNVLIVLSDDLGYGDLGCYGNREIQTPHVDRLAREGLRLTSCYAAAPNCSPSRGRTLARRRILPNRRLGG